jgi:hypothetical protein
MRTFDKNYNVEPEIYDGLELVDEIVDFLNDIRLALELGEDISTFLRNLDPPFDPLKTFGKYC